MKKSRSTRSHFTHARSCSRALNQVPARAKRPAFIRTYSLWQGDIFPYDRFTSYKKSNQNQFGRALPFAFALTCYNIYLLYSSLSDFDSFRWRVHLSDGVCRLHARVHLKTLSSLLKVAEHSFRARSCWCDYVRAQGLLKQTCRWYSDHFICSIPTLSLLFFFVIERSVLMALVFYNKDMLEKVTTQRTQQFLNFSKSKEPS